jgi:translation initiation factor eIF-2B subunit alpha
LFPVSTVQELHSTLKNAENIMKNSEKPVTAIVSASELFSRFITFTSLDKGPMEQLRKLMLDRGKTFLKKLLESRAIIARQGAQFIYDDCVRTRAFILPTLY